MTAANPELAVVIPVYNEEAIVAEVIKDWSKYLTGLGIDFQIHLYNDGSKDNTLQVLNQCAQNYERVIVHNKPNSGHGPTILLGYRENSAANWIFQIDSDNEMGTDSFEKLWVKRNEYDFLIGQRASRDKNAMRQIVSFGSRTAVRIFYGSGVYDVNSPYRLMRCEALRDYFYKIPDYLFAPNVIISGIVCLKNYRVFESPVSYNLRTTGEVSIKRLKLLKVALLSLVQTISFRWNKACK